jgi:hypothetical protein
MRITKLSIPVLMLAFAFLASSTLAAETTHFSFPGQIGMFNPCDGSVVIVKGTNTVDYHENTSENGTHAVVHIRFEGIGQDSAGNPFATSFNAKSHFDAVASSYDLPFHSVWIGQGAPNFSMDGTVRVFVTDGSAVGAGIVQWTTSCKNEDHSNEAHSKEGHSNEGHSREGHSGDKD